MSVYMCLCSVCLMLFLMDCSGLITTKNDDDGDVYCAAVIKLLCCSCGSQRLAVMKL